MWDDVNDAGYPLEETRISASKFCAACQQLLTKGRIQSEELGSEHTRGTPAKLDTAQRSIHKTRINHLLGQSKNPANALTVLRTIQNPQKMEGKSHRRFDSNPGLLQVIWPRRSALESIRFGHQGRFRLRAVSGVSGVVVPEFSGG